MPQRTRTAFPEGVKRLSRRMSLPIGRATARQRMEPDFLMIGAQRCGTSSLFRALMAHPQILRPVMHKGVNYFDLNHFRGDAWYRAHFPVRTIARTRTKRYGEPHVFEASGYYLYHPFAPQRIRHDLPDVKLIALLRDPIERAYSAYQHELARGFEWETFDRALDLEDERLAGEVKRMAYDETYESFAHRHHSYTRRGHYAEQLAVYAELFDRSSLLLIESEAFFADPQGQFRRVVDFLGLADVMPTQFGRYNAQPRADMATRTRRRLEEHFAEHDVRLEEFLGGPPGWRSG
jgi:hypothetical protein